MGEVEHTSRSQNQLETFLSCQGTNSTPWCTVACIPPTIRAPDAYPKLGPKHCNAYNRASWHPKTVILLYHVATWSRNVHYRLQSFRKHFSSIPKFLSQSNSQSMMKFYPLLIWTSKQKLSMHWMLKKLDRTNRETMNQPLIRSDTHTLIET